MRPLSNIFSKEVRELLTPATVLPIVVLAILFGSLGGIMGDVGGEASKPPIIGIIQQDDSELANYTAMILDSESDVVYKSTDIANIDEGLKAVSSAGGTALLVIPQGFGDDIQSNRSGTIRVYWIMKGTGMLDTISSASLDGLLGATDKLLSLFILENKMDVNVTTALNPTIKNETTTFKGNTLEGISPSSISATLSSQNMVVPLIVMMVIIMSGSSIIGSMGLEKENKTLETLLTMPVRRSDIVLAKLGGAAAVGLLMAVIYMLGMGNYVGSLQGSTGLDLSAYGIKMEMVDFALVGISLFLAVVSGLALCLVISVFARDYKSAQSLTMPITFLAMIPMFVLMMKDFATLPTVFQAGLFAIPFTHPMMAMNNLMFGDYTLVVAGLVYEATFASAMMAVAVILFKKDILVTGRKKKREGKEVRTWPRRR
ncbi:MAG TPA: ABC transporter permease [Euryarchaeota archaeon]|nr:ABC transporter permease [Euryarchaeota archaeon]